ncbi:unnamed protein product [Lupinus luteus]|uniref:BED-type domain-containing protein n=1 Tax=Lupinus luteus TaxID=3873 RepID=A0AAV1YNJ8_LUPLU
MYIKTALSLLLSLPQASNLLITLYFLSSLSSLPFPSLFSLSSSGLHIMDSSVGDCEILETSTQNNSRNVQEKESTNVSQSEQKIGTPLTSQPEPKSGKTLTSDAWRYFEKAGIIDGKEKARCLGCKKLLSCSTKNGGGLKIMI